MKTIKKILTLFILLSICFTCKKEDAETESYYKNLLVYKDGKIITKEYSPVADSAKPRDVRSVTKSVMATLIGIAIDKGFIQSEYQKIGDFLRPLVKDIDEAKANLKIRDLLSMSSGISGTDLKSVTEYENWHNAPNQLEYTLAQPLNNQPGKTFIYNSGASHLLSIILTKATGMTTFQFAKKYLFQPLNISDHNWEKDKQGYYNGSAGLCLTINDMLKIGQLYLDKGKYNGVRIVSEYWIDKVSSFKINTYSSQPFAESYGYLFWLGSTQEHNYFFANGYGGQFIVIVPDLKIIVAAQNKWSGIDSNTANQNWYETLDRIVNNIIGKYLK